MSGFQEAGTFCFIHIESVRLACPQSDERFTVHGNYVIVGARSDFDKVAIAISGAGHDELFAP